MKKILILALGIILASLGAQPAQAVESSFDLQTNEEQNSMNLRFGKNLLLAGNKVSGQAEAEEGLLITAGNILDLDTDSEYGFVFGNSINFSGTTKRDLYAAGNFVTLDDDAQIGRDVYAAASTVEVLTDLPGDLNVTAAEVTLKDVKIAGNVNLDVDEVTFSGTVEIAGRLTYNDTATVNGIANVKASETEVYEVVKIDQGTIFAAKVYSKVLSMVALFLAMVLICVSARGLHTKIARETTANRFGTNLAVGVGILIGVPMVALISFFTIVAAPLGIVALVLYGVMIYLAQGFSGLWLGHLILEKLMKAKSNVYAESALGIFILGVLSLVPYVGVITGFLGMLLGMGLIVACLRANKTADPKVVEGVEVAD